MTDGEEEMKASIHNQEAAEYRKFYRDTLFNDVMPFWMRSDLIDRKYGGYISSVDRYGKSYNDDKSVWFQGRCLWTFSALCNRYGINDDFKVAAELGKTFLEINALIRTDVCFLR